MAPVAVDDDHRETLRAAHLADEEACVGERLRLGTLPPEAMENTVFRARHLIEQVRARGTPAFGIDAFLSEYALSTEEGVALMCLAEALLRIPDEDTAERLIRDKIVHGDWRSHLGHSSSAFVNASTWALMMGGWLLHGDADEEAGGDWPDALDRFLARSGEPVIREAMYGAMRVLGRQFVIGRTIDEALDHARAAETDGFRFSYDMLGEAAMTAADADRYAEAYAGAIEALGRTAGGRPPLEAPGLSVKLSALHPRFEFAQGARLRTELAPRLLDLCRRARDAGVGLTVDAEEAERLEPTLDVLERVSGDSSLKGWDGLGLAVQAYQKRALPLIDWLADMARRHGRRLMVRLVKGAYWDTEIKRAQILGLPEYPVFTRKAATDVSFLACARRLFEAGDAFYPAFATHNAHSAAAVIELAATAGGEPDYEFQRLYGMGEALHDLLSGPEGMGQVTRIYAPVGSHEELLPYLVRRLLENGANTSFVNRIGDAAMPVHQLAADPAATLRARDSLRHPRIPLPGDMLAGVRRNSRGLDLADPAQVHPLLSAIEARRHDNHRACPVISGRDRDGAESPVRNPADTDHLLGTVREASSEACAEAVDRARAAQPAWDAVPAGERAAVLERAADLVQEHRAELMALAVFEAGKTLDDALAEVREAADFLYHYAARARADFAGPAAHPGPTGERNETRLAGRGAFVCISPWNFPLAIFTGQVAAALAAGNTVLAKPAEQTPLIAHRAVQLLHRAGVPGEALHLLPGRGETVGQTLVDAPGIAGVAFTGSVATAHRIHRSLAARDGPIPVLIAETGGQNAMIADSSALPEQLTADVVRSAFHSAGQRCSALRVLFLQEDNADRVLEMIAGHMAELTVGDPARLDTDVGPVIDAGALQTLQEHVDRMEREARLIARTPLSTGDGHFIAPQAFEIPAIELLDGEVFGPILHVVRWPAADLDAVIEAVNATGYGLTLGIHSRIRDTVDHIVARARVGNTYVNRNQVGSVVGVQPFGGEGLSGTGPKAGGYHTLHRFAVERTLTVNTAAAGGNAALMSLGDET